MNQSSISTKRLVWADCLKAFLIMIVVLDHAIQYAEKDACFYNHFWNITSSFYLPAFMAVSGWLSYRGEKKKTNLIKLISRRFQQLLIPFFIWATLKLLRWSSITLIWETLKVPDGSFWFLWTLFFIFLIFQVSKFFGEITKISEDIMLLLSTILLILVMVLFEVRVYGFQFIAYYYIYYVLGYYFHKYPILLHKNLYLNIFLFLLWVVFGWNWNMHELPSWMPTIPYIPNTLLQYTYRGVTAVSIIYVIFNVFPVLFKKQNNYTEILSKIGSLTLGIYVVHLMVMKELSPVVELLLPKMNTILLEIITFIVAFIISWSIVIILSKNKWTARYLFGKI